VSLDETKELVRVVAGGRSDGGPVRPNNEDCLAINEALRLYIVADGMGGHQAGEVASRLAVDSVTSFLFRSRDEEDLDEWPFGQDAALSREGNRLRNAIALANERVWRTAQSSPTLAGMGTTIVAAMLAEARVIIGHVGDSRLYMRRGGTLAQVTVDDSWAVHAPELQLRDESGRVRSGVLTSVLGGDASVTVHVAEQRWEPGDALVLCSDGLHGVVDDAELDRVLQAHAEPAAAAHELVESAIEHGTRDNVSVIVVRREA
jgi:protein phosphatase